MKTCDTCGGKGGHVPWCSVKHAEDWARDVEFRASLRTLEDQETARREALVGQRLTAVDVQRSAGFVRLRFESGATFTISLTGGELDGHFDPPANRSLLVETKS